MNDCLRAGFELKPSKIRAKFRVHPHDSRYVSRVDLLKLNQMVDELDAESFAPMMRGIKPTSYLSGMAWKPDPDVIAGSMRSICKDEPKPAGRRKLQATPRKKSGFKPYAGAGIWEEILFGKSSKASPLSSFLIVFGIIPSFIIRAVFAPS